MCMSAGTSNAASLTSTSTLTTAAAAASNAMIPAMGDDAADGAQAIRRDTGFDAADPLDQAVALAGQLHAQLQQAQQLAAGGAGGAGGAGTDTVGGSSAPTSFAAAAAQRSNLQLRPMVDGAAVVSNLDAIVQARTERIDRLEAAAQDDPAVGPVEQARLRLLESY